MRKQQLIIFGEALFDCFETGEAVMGGAPFNVAWHLQALGDKPQFVTRIGGDKLGKSLLKAMDEWVMNTRLVQVDEQYATGTVQITLNKGEPNYDIVNQVAYDFIELPELSSDAPSLLYHGSLALRHSKSAKTLKTLSAKQNIKTFMDVNLRSPWWSKQDLLNLLEQSSWVKLNQYELALLGFSGDEVEEQSTKFMQQFALDGVLLTLAEQGAYAITAHGEHYRVVPQPCTDIVDTVGAGDAFSAMFIHGLLNEIPLAVNMEQSQEFASKTLARRGAIQTDSSLYETYLLRHN